MANSTVVASCKLSREQQDVQSFADGKYNINETCRTDALINALTHD